MCICDNLHALLSIVNMEYVNTYTIEFMDVAKGISIFSHNSRYAVVHIVYIYDIECVIFSCFNLNVFLPLAIPCVDKIIYIQV